MARLILNRLFTGPGPRISLAPSPLLSALMNANTSGQSQSYESLFGPPSEKLLVADFLHALERPTPRDASPPQSPDQRASTARARLSANAEAEWLKLSEERRKAVEDECRYGSSSKTRRVLLFVLAMFQFYGFAAPFIVVNPPDSRKFCNAQGNEMIHLIPTVEF